MSKEKKHGLGKFLIGAGLGIGLGMLFAPKSGKETRKDLKEKMDNLVEKAKNTNIQEVKETIEAKVLDIKESLKKLDKETVTSTIKEQADNIRYKVDDLVNYAVSKGTPIVESAAREVKTSTVKALESITTRLKDEEPSEVTKNEKPKTAKKKTNSASKK